MRIDPNESVYHEDPKARGEFSKEELERLRILLRRLRFLEHKVANGASVADDTSGGGMFAKWERDALEFVLTELGFLAEKKERASA